MKQWGTEHLFKVYYSDLPKFSAVSGYTGGTAVNPCKLLVHPFKSTGKHFSLLSLRPHSSLPAYRQVCSGTTGHAEAVKVTWEKGSVGYGELVEFFFRTHDPTTVDRQGPDRGSREYCRRLTVTEKS